MRRTTAALALATAVVAAACATGPEEPETIRLIAHDSFVAGAAVAFEPFTEDTGIEVELVAARDAGALVNQAILTKDNPLADVLFGVDDTFLSRALDESIFLPYEAAGADDLPDELRIEGDPVTPIDYGDVCINYDKAAFAGREVPDDLDDLRDPVIAGALTVEHPATSSPGLAFMLATIAIYGEDGWLGFWEDLKEGGVSIASDWDTAYYNEFTRYGGDSSLVVSYASSPPAEVIFAEEPLDEAPTGVVTAGCYRQVEYAGILEGTAYPDAARSLIDYMVSPEFQEMVPLSWFVFPVNPDAELPAEFVEHTVIPSDPARLDARQIAENRDRWIDEWVAVMEG